MTTPRWIELAGAFNVRDLGALPAGSGRTRDGVLLRADNLDSVTPADVRVLVDEHPHIGRGDTVEVVGAQQHAVASAAGPGGQSAEVAHVERAGELDPARGGHQYAGSGRLRPARSRRSRR